MIAKKKLTYTELYAEQFKQKNFISTFHPEYNGTQQVEIFTENCYDGIFDIPKFKSKNGHFKYLFVQEYDSNSNNYYDRNNDDNYDDNSDDMKC